MSDILAIALKMAGMLSSAFLVYLAFSLAWPSDIKRRQALWVIPIFCLLMLTGMMLLTG